MEKKKIDDEAKKRKAEEAENKKKLREQQNKEAIEERERQHQEAIAENRRHLEKERVKRATTAAAAADRRLSSTLSSNEETLSPGALKIDTTHSTSSMEVDQSSVDDDDDSEDEEDDDADSEGSELEEEEPTSVEKEEDGATDVLGSSNEGEQKPAHENSTDEEDDENIGLLDTTQFYEAFDDAIQLHHQAARVALVGGSNVPNIKLVSDTDLQVQTHALWEGGAVITQGADKVSEVDREVRDNFDIIVTHIGACNFPCKGEASVMSTFKDYRDMTNKVRDLCPDAHILMSGILPQAGEDRQIANDQIWSFNAALKAVGDDENEPNLHYCDNWPHFVKDGQVLDKLFKDPHTYGVHVNDPGSVILAQSIMQQVKKVFYWERLGVPLSPSH